MFGFGSRIYSSHSQPLGSNCPRPAYFSSTSAALGGNLFAPSECQTAFSWSNNASASTTTTSAPTSVALATFPSPNGQSGFVSSSTPSLTIFNNPVSTSTTLNSSSSLSSPTLSSFMNIDPPKSPVFSNPFLNSTSSNPFLNRTSSNPFHSASTFCWATRPAATTSTTPTLVPTPGFDFSSTPLRCFSNFPPSNFTSPSRIPSIFNKLTSPSGGQQLTPKQQVCPRCGHTSFWGPHWGSRVAPYTTTPDDSFASMHKQHNLRLNSISAMPVYEDRSHEELRWQDYQGCIQGKAKGCVTQACESSTSGQQVLVLPVFVLPAMPTISLSGFSAFPWTPSLGSTVGLGSSTPPGTTVPALAASPAVLGVPGTNAPVLGQPAFSVSSSTPVMPAVFPRCEMFRRL